MVAAHPQTDSSFFHLPAEIRQKIQRLALAPRDNDALFSSEGATSAQPEILFRTYEEPLPAVMRTCKQMYMDMSQFVFTEMTVYVYESAEGPGTQTSIKCYGNLRYEHLRRVSLVVAIENSNFVSPTWSTFLFSLLRCSPNIDRLDIEFYKNDFQEKVDRELAAAQERLQNNQQQDRDSFILKHYAQPEWLEEVARQPSLRWVYFEGNVPRIWLQRLRRESKGTIQVFSDGVRFREKPGEEIFDTTDEYGRHLLQVQQFGKKPEDIHDTNGSQDVEFTVVYDPASRFD